MVSLVQLYPYPEVPDEPGLIKRPVMESQFDVYSKLLNNESNFWNSLETIRRFVLGQGMRVTKKQGDFRMSSHIQNALDTEWMVTLAEIARSLSAFGVCIVDKNKYDMPIIRKFADFQCTQLEWRDGTMAWHVVWKPQGAIGSNPTNVMGNTTMPPLFGKAQIGEADILKTGFVLIRNHIDADGSLRGDARRMLATAQLQSFAIECSAKAWIRQAAPAVMMQQRKKDAHQLELDAERGRLGDNEEAVEESTLRRNEANVMLAGRNEQLVRQLNSAGARDGYTIPTVLKDPYLGLPVLPLNRSAEPAVNVCIPLPEDNEYVTATLAQAPSDFVGVLGATQTDAANSVGLPAAMLAAERQPRRVNETTMNVFHATANDWRHVMSSVAKFLLNYIYGVQNYYHMFTQAYDFDKSLDENMADNEFDVQFDAAVDHEVINSLMDRGMMSWKDGKHLVHRYTGIPLQMLTEEQLEVATQKPIRILVEQQRALQMQMAQQNMEQSAQQFHLAEKAFELSAKGTKVKIGKDGKKTEEKIKVPGIPTPMQPPDFDPADLTPMYFSGALTANGKTEAGGKSVGKKPGKGLAKGKGLGKRSTQGDSSRTGLKKSLHG